uniref:Uncharacterized protein n=1 Tax=Meloidogyne enterolobii TaxID=390850 RepID=A0A6V7XNH2_MELEN|nr:unnamed protein product [Meloidogyne enterolobii]
MAFCKEQLLKLCSEKRLLDEKLREVKRLINSLEEMCLLPEEIKQEDSKGSREGKISEFKENLKIKFKKYLCIIRIYLEIFYVFVS